MFVFVSPDSKCLLREARSLRQLPSRPPNQSPLFRQVAERAFEPPVAGGLPRLIEVMCLSDSPDMLEGNVWPVAADRALLAEAGELE